MMTRMTGNGLEQTRPRHTDTVEIAKSVATDRDLAIDAQRFGATEHRLDAVAIEEPLEIRVGRPGEPGVGQALSVTMRTPGHDRDLAIGFLHGEGIVRQPGDVVDARHCGPSGSVLRVDLRADLAFDPASLSRNFYTTSSCGVCGKTSIEAVTASAGLRHVGLGPIVRGDVLDRMPPALVAAQVQFARTGGVHGVGLFDANGALLGLREDVGRHNAMDKLVGAALQAGELPWTDRIVLLSGRASFELLQKAMLAGAPVVAAIGAPSTLAVELAESAGITLVAFLRPGSCNVYSHGRRIQRRSATG
jgi:FdhD protein